MIKSARILILTNGSLARNPRVVKEAMTLGHAGYKVTVLGVRNHIPSVRLDKEITSNAPFTYRQLELLSGPRAWLRRARTRLAREIARHGGPASVHSLGPAAALLTAARREPADLVIGHNEIAHWAVTRLIGSVPRIAADIEDWHSEDLLPVDRASRPIRQLRQIEYTLLNRADYVTTTSQALAEALHSRYGGRRPSVITNSFPLPNASERVETAAKVPALFWFSQTIGPGRGLESFLAAYAKVSAPSRLVLLGDVNGDYGKYLLSLLPEKHRHRIQFHPPVSPLELPDVIAKHDIGLALEQASIRNRDLTITNKILQYLGAGLAVVATPTAGQREVLAHSPDAGLILRDLTDTSATATALQNLIVQPSGLRLQQAAARKLAEDHYCWEREAPRLVAMVNQSLNIRT